MGEEQTVPPNPERARWHPTVTAAVITGLATLLVGLVAVLKSPSTAEGGGTDDGTKTVAQAQYAKKLKAAQTMLSDAQYNSAVDAFKETIELGKQEGENVAQAWAGLSEAYYQARKDNLSEDAALEAIRLDPEVFEAQYRMAIILVDKDDDEGAIRYFLRARELRPDYHTLYKKMGDAYMRLGDRHGGNVADYNSARNSYRDAVRTDIGCAISHYNLALANCKVGDGAEQEAVNSLRNAIRLDSSFRKDALDEPLMDRTMAILEPRSPYDFSGG